MRTALDDQDGCYGWLIESIVHRPPELILHLVEGIEADAPTAFTVGEHTVQDARAVEVTAESRRFEVVFEDVVAHQVIDEFYVTSDEHEQPDGTDQVQVMARSRFLAFLQAHHGWMFDVVEGLRHYRVSTLDAIVDVVAQGVPRVEPTRRQPSSEDA